MRKVTRPGGRDPDPDPGSPIPDPDPSSARPRRHPPHSAERVLLITGPNPAARRRAQDSRPWRSGQAGLHIPAETGSRLPVFQSLSPTSRRASFGEPEHLLAHITTSSRGPEPVLPALVLLDEVGAGTDPAEGGALGIAVIDHFRTRGAHLVATTHYDALKSYASTTDGVTSAAFGFNPESFAPTYRLIYGSPGRSLAIEIAARLGMPPSVDCVGPRQSHGRAEAARRPSGARRQRSPRARAGTEGTVAAAATVASPRGSCAAGELVRERGGDVPPKARYQA